MQQIVIERSRADLLSVPYSHAEAPDDVELLLYALPRSPPGWMKSNGEIQHGAGGTMTEI